MSGKHMLTDDLWREYENLNIVLFTLTTEVVQLITFWVREYAMDILRTRHFRSIRIIVRVLKYSILLAYSCAINVRKKHPLLILTDFQWEHVVICIGRNEGGIHGVSFPLASDGVVEKRPFQLQFLRMVDRNAQKLFWKSYYFVHRYAQFLRIATIQYKRKYVLEKIQFKIALDKVSGDLKLSFIHV